MSLLRSKKIITIKHYFGNPVIKICVLPGKAKNRAEDYFHLPVRICFELIFNAQSEILPGFSLRRRAYSLSIRIHQREAVPENCSFLAVAEDAKPKKSCM